MIYKGLYNKYLKITVSGEKLIMLLQSNILEKDGARNVKSKS